MQGFSSNPNLENIWLIDEVMGNKNRKQAREPIEKTFSNDKLGSIVRKERQKAGTLYPLQFILTLSEAAAEWDEMEAIRRSQQYDFTTASAPENAVHNRYPNVMAIEATRVMVTDKYINANWIDGRTVLVLLFV